MKNQKILILTLSFGSGHVRAAQAIAARLEKDLPDAEIRIIDALENCALWFRAFYVWTYWTLIRYAPKIWEKFFDSRVARRDTQTAPVWMWRAGCRKVFEDIKNFQPDLIVAAEVGACEISVIAQREKMTNAKIINVITDFEAEPIWVKPETAAFTVASSEVKTQLENWGADPQKIRVCGIPIDAEFAEKFSECDTRRRFGFNDLPIVLLMGGGMGPSQMDKIARLLLEKGENFNIAALPGKDARAKKSLLKLKNAPTVKLLVLDWTNEIAALMQAAIVLATKPGGLTLAEAAASGVPLVLFDQIPGPEAANIRYFVENRAAVETKSANEAADKILSLLDDAGTLAETKTNLKKLSLPDATGQISKLIAENLSAKIFDETSPEESTRVSNYRKAFAQRHKPDAKSAFSKVEKI